MDMIIEVFNLFDTDGVLNLFDTDGEQQLDEEELAAAIFAMNLRSPPPTRVVCEWTALGT